MNQNSIVLTIVVAIFASSGFWAFLTSRLDKKDKKSEAEKKALLGLLHDRIYDLANTYIARGSITIDEYDNFKGLYDPYADLGGNGTGRRLKQEVDKIKLIGGEHYED